MQKRSNNKSRFARNYRVGYTVVVAITLKQLDQLPRELELCFAMTSDETVLSNITISEQISLEIPREQCNVFRSNADSEYSTMLK